MTITLITAVGLTGYPNKIGFSEKTLETMVPQKTNLLLVVIAVLLSVAVCDEPQEYAEEKETEFWHKVGKSELKATLEAATPRGVAKNVILFLGDGMGPTTVTAGRILAGQKKKRRGEEHMLSFDKFPFVGLSKTYNIDHQVTDSAASGTAYLCGVKANQETVGVNAQTLKDKCNTMNNSTKVTSILKWSADAMKSTGIVTTTRVTHASPAASYAHSPSRNWESDARIPTGEEDCEDIALQLILRNSHINVILGGGRAVFLPNNETDPDPDSDSEPDSLFDEDELSRRDGRHLIKMWEDDKKEKKSSHSVVFNKEEFDDVDPEKTDYLLGLFSQSHMQFEIDRNKTKEPSLAELTEKAIRILSKNNNGFFLMVEGGRIDHGHHMNLASKALHDVIALSDAVETAVNLTSKEDTLIVVTADHSHVMAIAGYSKRGNPILGLVEPALKTKDSKPYTAIVYGNGPGFNSTRQNLTGVDTEDKNYKQQTAVPTSLESHAGEDVAIYASGPQSFLYTGVHEQNYIPLVMAYASCVGPYREGAEACAKAQGSVGTDQDVKKTKENCGGNTAPALIPSNIFISWLVVLWMTYSLPWVF